jgi:hypothetical protein
VKRKVGPLRWKMPDGTELPATDAVRARIRAAAAMASMDDPEREEIGERQLEELAQLVTKQLESALQSKLNAKAPRPSRRSPIRAKVKDLMEQARTTDISYKNFLEAWLHEPQSGLCIRFNGRRYVVNDEYGKSAEYAPATLASLWSPQKNL